MHVKPDRSAADIGVFNGVHHVDLDEHGRLALPEPWRHPAIDENLTLVAIHREERRSFVRAFEQIEFERRVHALMPGSLKSPMRDPRFRMYLGNNAGVCAVDGQWRLDLSESPQLRNLFDTEVTLIGRERFFELRRTDHYWEGFVHFEPDQSFQDLI